MPSSSANESCKTTSVVFVRAGVNDSASVVFIPVRVNVKSIDEVVVLDDGMFDIVCEGASLILLILSSSLINGPGAWLIIGEGATVSGWYMFMLGTGEVPG